MYADTIESFDTSQQAAAAVDLCLPGSPPLFYLSDVLDSTPMSRQRGSSVRAPEREKNV